MLLPDSYPDGPMALTPHIDDVTDEELAYWAHKARHDRNEFGQVVRDMFELFPDRMCHINCGFAECEENAITLSVKKQTAKLTERSRARDYARQAQLYTQSYFNLGEPETRHESW